MKVLLVEDEVLTREGIYRCVPWDILGIKEVYTAEDGEEGLQKAEKISPDIIIADVRMPKMDGITMAFEIRKVLKNCHFIFVSAYCDKEYLKSAIWLSAESYIEKPIEISEVVEALKKSIMQVEEEKRRKALEEEYRTHFQDGYEVIAKEDMVPGTWNASMCMADKIEAYIRDNFADADLSLTQIADHFKVTRQYMCWLFKKEKNETVNHCIIRTRIKWAKEYIQRNPNAKIKNVASKAGFADCSYFIKIYKKYEQITPTDYLRRCNEKRMEQ